MPEPLRSLTREEVWESIKDVQRRHDAQAPLNHVNTVEWVDAVMPLVHDRNKLATRVNALEIELHLTKQRFADFVEAHQYS